jgi:16S rRNA (guanine527-N7)-methyltransferase
MIRKTLVQGAKTLGLDLTEENIWAFELFASELKKWNRKVNLTAITSDSEIAIKHFIDSLLLERMLGDAINILDIGSGAGLPALAIKIVRPATAVTSVDAVAKKIHFQRHVARLLQLEGFDAVHARIENLHQSHAGAFDVITSRAFSDLSQFVSLAAPLLAENGRIIAMKGPASSNEMPDSIPILEAYRLEINSVHSYSLPENNGERRLIIISSAGMH